VQKTSKKNWFLLAFFAGFVAASFSQPTATISVASNYNGQDVSCNGVSDGSAIVTPSGGVTPYTYSWSNGQTDSTATALLAGAYSVTVTDNNSDTVSATITLTEPALLSTSTLSSNVSCNSGSDGAIDLTVSGGTTSYSYSWSNAGTTEDLSGLSVGTYAVTVTDANSCTDTASVTITEPPLLTLSATSTDVSCFTGSDGTATANPSGGTTPYGYSWSTGSTTQSISSLSAGTYTVTVTDANSCTGNASTTVNEPLELIASATATDVSCNGGSDGTATASVSGGTTNYSYLWDAAVGSQTTATATGLSAGTYIITVTDGNGCTDTASAIVTEPPSLISSASSTDVSCFNGSDGTVTASESGGTSPYTYSWSTGSTLQTVTALQAGNYTVTVTDGNGCTDIATTTVNEPAELIPSVTPTDVSCFNGSDGTATANPSGGTTPYGYNWNTGSTAQSISSLSIGTYAVTVTDANSCTDTASTTVNEPPELIASATATDVSCNGGSDGTATASASGGTTNYSYMWDVAAGSQTTATATGLSAGTYIVTATDGNGCTDTASAIVTEPPLLTSSATATNVSCNGGSDGTTTASASGGTTNYSYLWDAAAGSQTTATATGLSAGTYIVTVTDGNGCTNTASATVTEPPPLTSSATATDVTCNGGSDGTATASVSGGTSPYTYNWSNGQTNATTTGLSAGTYTVTITDANNCDTTTTATLNEPQPLSASTSSTDVSCNGGNDGTATATASGETSPYSYSWSNGGNQSSISGLSAGTYTATIIDVNNCDTITEQVTITEADSLVVSITSSDVKCLGGNDGAATADATGGTPAYNYAWSTGANTQTINTLKKGTYAVTVTDANNCTETQVVTISEGDCDISPSIVFTPNGDGFNDTWTILNTESYQNSVVDVYNRWGQRVHHQKGQYVPWDGRSLGIIVPFGTYYFVVTRDKENKNLGKKIGSVTIVK